MNSEEIKSKLTPLMEKIFNVSGLVLTPEMTARDVKGWDSLNNIRLLVAIDESFNISLKTNDVIGVKNVGDLIALIGKYTG